MTAWQADNPPHGTGTGNRWTFALVNNQFVHLNAGLPSLDISPSTDTGPHFGALVYVQETGEDGFGPIMDVYEIDSFNLTSDWPPIHTLISVDSTDPAVQDGLFPSIMLHNLPGPEASITYMAQKPNSDIYSPRVYRVIIPTNGGPKPVPVYHQSIDPAILIMGNYYFGKSPFLNPGISTASTAAESSYWLAWCNRIEMESPPTDVFGIFGVAE